MCQKIGNTICDTHSYNTLYELIIYSTGFQFNKKVSVRWMLFCNDFSAVPWHIKLWKDVKICYAYVVLT